MTIGFVDLAGFTALTEVHGDEVAVDMLDAFVATAEDGVRSAGAELVKSIGDAVMVAADTPAAAIRAVQHVFEASYATDSFPEPRAGLHHGPVIARNADYFGATVNLAARVASKAGSGQAFATASLVAAAGELGLDVVQLGPYELRNVLEPVELWAIEVAPTHVDLSVDPVCRMRVSCQAAIGRVRHGGHEYALCSLDCLRAFAGDPDRYIAAL